MKISSKLQSANFYLKKCYARIGFNIPPKVFIIGAQKAATTSLQNYLVQHPNFINPLAKEVRYFNNDTNYRKGETWYLSHFPAVPYKEGMIALDATPEYLYHQWVPERIHKFNPEARLIAILRNPVERAYSAWNMYRHFYLENSSFNKIFDKPYRTGYENNIKKEFFLSGNFPSFEDVVENEIKKINAGSPLIEPSILRRGMYAKQLKCYFKFFPKNQILILDFQSVKYDIKNSLNQILEFINLPTCQWNYLANTPENKREYSKPMSSEMRLFLNNFFKPYNQELYTLLDKDFNWNK